MFENHVTINVTYCIYRLKGKNGAMNIGKKTLEVDIGIYHKYTEIAYLMVSL